MTDLPEPAVWQWEDLFTATQMREYRNQALEEAAKVCDELFADVPPYSAPDCASAIRALKEVKP